MNRTQNIVPLRDLNLTSRFLYDAVMEDPIVHQAALSIIFGKEIPILSHNESEKEFRVSPHIRSIRMDMFSMAKDTSVYNSEMQNQKKPDIPKRSRYYQAMLDIYLLEPGIPDYNELNDSYIITIMTFDLFGKKRYVYTFRPQCQEDPSLYLEDGTTRIFLNTKGENPEEISEELRYFLEYIENTTDEVAEKSKSERIKIIHDKVQKVKKSEEVGIKYMQAWEERYYDMKEARELGLSEGHSLGLSEGHSLGLSEGHSLGLSEGHSLGLSEGHSLGLSEGSYQKLISQTIKKLQKNKTADVIAEELEESPELITRICDIAKEFAPSYDLIKIYNLLFPKTNV